MRYSPGTYAASALLPPLGVFWTRGPGPHFAIASVLTVLGFLPGVAYALIQAFKPEADGPEAATAS